MPAPTLRPFFSFFGSKWRLAKFYPPPEHDLIIEPFAGSAGYAGRHYDREVILVEKCAFLASLWRWLISVSADELHALPLAPEADLAHLPIDAQHLIRFHWANGRSSPASWRSARPSWNEATRDRLARQVQAIRHWRVIEGDYQSAPDVRATWFIDPPYQGARHYLARVEDYSYLGLWARTRMGLSIVCEYSKAEWLPFKPFQTITNIQGNKVTEGVFIARDGKPL